MTPPLHILATMGLVRRDGRVLMIESPRRGWELPGGQVEMGEDPVAGLRREVEEETGCTIEAERLAAVNTNVGASPYPIVMLDYVCRYSGGEIRASAESLRVEWMTPDQAVSAVTRPSMVARLKHLLHSTSGVRSFSYRLDPFEVASDQVV